MLRGRFIRGGAPRALALVALAALAVPMGRAGAAAQSAAGSIPTVVVPRLTPPRIDPILYAHPAIDVPDAAALPDDVHAPLAAWRAASDELTRAARAVHERRASTETLAPLDERLAETERALSLALRAHDDLCRQGWSLRGAIERQLEERRYADALDALATCARDGGTCAEPERDLTSAIAAWEHVGGDDALARRARLEIAWALADEDESERALSIAREALASSAADPFVEAHLARLAAWLEDRIGPRPGAPREGDRILADRILADLSRAARLGVAGVSTAAALEGASLAVRLDRWQTAIALATLAREDALFTEDAEALLGYAVARIGPDAPRQLATLSPTARSIAIARGAERLREEGRGDRACELLDTPRSEADCAPAALETQLAFELAQCGARDHELLPEAAVIEIDRRGRLRFVHAPHVPPPGAALRRCVARAVITPPPPRPVRAHVVAR